MSASGFTLFPTAIGCCGIAWGERGVTAVHLPEAHERQLRERLHRQFPTARETAAPPPAIRDAIEAIVALLDGEPRDLRDVVGDLDHVPPFHRRVYEIARTIPPGATLTYGEIAHRLGAEPGAARAVGQALGANPVPIVVPCHRVLAAGGRLGGFSARGGTTTKRRMLEIEGALEPAPEPLTLFDPATLVATA